MPHASQAGEKSESEHAHRKLPLDQLPASVRSTFDREAAGGQIEELRSEQRNGTTVYEGEIIANGKGTKLEVGSDGKVLKRSAPHQEMNEHESEHNP
jgi:hypothetical protein